MQGLKKRETNVKTTLAIFACLAGTIAGAVVSVPAWAQTVSQPAVRTAAPRVAQPNMQLLSLMKVWQPGDPVKRTGDLQRRALAGQPPTQLQAVGPDPLLGAQSIAGSGAQPAIVAEFDGIPATGFAPPDMMGAVGRNHYIQMVNVAFAIFDKKGQRLAGPTAINSAWEGFGGPCENENAGDPVTRYDHIADRWIISQFAIEQNFQCIAVSRGPNPVTDGWFLYAFPTVTAQGTPVTPDYPKLTVWPDGYYMGTQRGFPGGGLDVWVFEREKMLTGQSARQVQFSVDPPSLFLMPSDLDGPPPPPGTPNFFIRHVDGKLWGGQDRLELFEFAVNWTNPEQSTFKLATQIPTAAFSAMLCGDTFSGNCASQPGTTEKLETLPAWIMWRLQYRNFGSRETLVTNHTVNADGQNRAGIRWYELRRQPGGSWTKFQEGTHSPELNPSLHGKYRNGHRGEHRLGIYRVQRDDVSHHQGGDPTAGRSSQYALRRKDPDQRHRFSDIVVEPMGRLFVNGCRPRRTLHVLVHYSVLHRDVGGWLAYAHHRNKDAAVLISGGIGLRRRQRQKSRFAPCRGGAHLRSR